MIRKFWGFLLVLMVAKMMGLGRDGPGSDFMGTRPAAAAAEVDSDPWIPVERLCP